MHELGMCEGVVAAVERRAAGRPVARVGVRVGTLLRVVPAAFEQSFQMVAAGGVADGAGTEIAIVPVQARCRDCDISFESHDPAPVCAACGSLAVDRYGGEELVLEWLQYRDAPTSGDASPPAGAKQEGA